MKSKLKQILKTWAVVTVSTFMLCFLTQHGAKILFNIDLPEQGGLEEFRKMIGLNWRFALNVALAVFILPPVEELLFRFLAFRMIARKAGGEWRSQGFCLAAIPPISRLLKNSIFLSFCYATTRMPSRIWAVSPIKVTIKMPSATCAVSVPPAAAPIFSRTCRCC